ncbi:hypothetical protein BOX15_Mlig027588g1 [Macrostomum lignano]|uniref:protein disulfide-isomerase n=2 Tax=Macrostomum lignano TaxID=282301 RepID=A0A1I8IWA7_9PLAT|nr:hypothetical protein BOX15_Mlig027588g1 [Macrostomum lignano]
MRLVYFIILFALAAVVALTASDESKATGGDPSANSKEEKKEELNEFDRQHEEAGILVLTDQNYEEVIKSYPAMLIKFYAPWCIHSREFAPEFVKAGFILKEKNSPVRLARVDASVEKKFAEKYDVKGYPTLKFFKGDLVIDYNGGKTGESVVSWIETKMKQATTAITTIKEAEEFTTADSVTLLGLFSKDNFTEMSKLLEDTAFTRLNEVPCGVTDNEELMAHYQVARDTILMFKNVDKERLSYEGPFDVDSIAAFVKANKLPLVVEFTHHSAPDIFGGDIAKHALLFVRKSQEQQFKSSFSQFRESAKSFKDRVIFIYIDVDNGDNEKILQFFGVKPSDPPSVRVIALDRNMSKFRPTFESVTTEGVTEFVQDVLDNKIDPHLASQELPDDWDKEPVKVLVRKNFDEVTMDQNKTVFVMFYAPWCDHSKELAPVWEQLAKDYAHNDTIMIAKMDSSENELPDMKVMSFPTLKLFPANSNDVIDYYGVDRKLESLKIFLDSNGKKQPGINDFKEPNEPGNNEDSDKTKDEEEKSDKTDDEGEVKSEEDTDAKQEL